MTEPDPFRHEPEAQPIDFLVYGKLLVAAALCGAFVWWILRVTQPA